jgi:aspartyl-tRNA(Asn)/glutamyl-tRNA(Gln) amidotransferase subunit A
MLDSAAACARLVRAGHLSPVEVAELVLERIDATQAVTNAFSQLRPEETLREARALAEGVARGDVTGPLAGVPVAVKDLFDVAGWETTGCCAGYRGRVAGRDAEAVRRLRAAGAFIAGKTNQHELGAGATNLVSACGPTRNPWDPARLTGGSSGGSGAAVAAGCVPLALGTDTGGSIRIPASMCGVAGLKPTFGAVSVNGVMPLAPSMDTVGPLSRTVQDVGLAFGVLAGRPVGLPGVNGLRLGVPEVFVTPPRADIAAAMESVASTLQEEGAVAVRLDRVEYDPEDWSSLAWRELFLAHGDLLAHPGSLGRPTRQLMEGGRDTGAPELASARARVARLRSDLEGALARVDALLAPATPFPAPLADEVVVSMGDGRTMDVRRGAISSLTRPVNLAGLPALAFPSGFSAEGMPLGVQLIGRPGDEPSLLALGAAWQDRTDHHRRAPT